MSTTVGAHSGAGPLSLMSCVRESSPLADFEPVAEKNVSKRKFWNPKKWFRKKQKTGEETSVQTHHQDQKEGDGSRSRSTGELSTDEEPSRSHNENRNSSNMHPGLSVSHDSVFHPLNSASSDLELDGAQSSSSLSISQPLGNADLQTELSSRLRLRRGRGDTSEDDEGLPRSPPCGSPAAAPDSFLILEKTANKDLPTKSHSTCSDGSLLSMDSSEMDDDSVGLQSRHSSKVSLNDKRTDIESDLELGPSFTATPLNHSAAHHKVSVRPKRTYGAPRRKKGQLSSALPATPEVNEDSSVRSVSPESATTEPISELYDGHRHRAPFSVPPDVKLKCNSLPAGAVPPTSESFRLSRSKSNAGKSQDDGRLLGEEREEKLSLFERLFPRRSGKKKRKDEERLVIKEESVSKMEVDGTNVKTSTIEERKTIQTQSTTIRTSTDTKSLSVSKPMVAPRTGAAARQRIQPIDIPVAPLESRAAASSTPEKTSFSPGTSPIHMELESVLRQRQLSSTVSPTASTGLGSPPQSPKPIRIPSPRTTTTRTSGQLQESRVSNEDIRSKIKIAGLSSLQQRVLSLNNASDEHESYKSLIDFPVRPAKPVAKSHSFKGAKTVPSPPDAASRTTVAEGLREKRKSVVKASSLDSVKNLEEPILNAELKLTLPKPMEVETDAGECEKVPTVAEKKQDNTCSSSTVEEHSVKTVTVPKSFSASSITISGPSHTAVVNVTSSKSEEFSTTTSSSLSTSTIVDNEKSVQRESQVSVTKIQLKHETTQVTKTSVVLPKPTVPEFLNMQLNKVDAKPASNVVLSIKSPKASLEEAFNPHPKSAFAFPAADSGNGGRAQLPRKFSKEDVEIIEKSSDSSTTSPPKTPPSEVVQLRFKKNDSKPSSRKSSVISISPDSPTVKDRALKARSISLDSLKTDDKLSSAKASQESLDKRQDGVVLRRKSFAKQHKDEEPELMKVFARRSLKLKDGDADQIQEAIANEQRQRDSDKENKVEIVPEAEKKVDSPKIEICKVTNSISAGPKMASKELPKEESIIFKQPLAEIKKPAVEYIKNGVEKDESEVQLRKSLNNNIFLASQRAASLNTPSKTTVNDFHIKKQASLNERRKTDQWITPKRQATEKDLTDNVEEKNEELVVETKNFSQRRAEWEKRVQQAQK